MVVDLVLSERERLARIRLVGQNRELRLQQAAAESPTREDAGVVDMVTGLRYQLLLSCPRNLQGEYRYTFATFLASTIERIIFNNILNIILSSFLFGKLGCEIFSFLKNMGS